MQCLIYLTVMTINLWMGVDGVYHKPSVQKITAPKGLKTDALFGYSIAYQQKIKRLIVSAPHANSVGQVFECDPSNGACKEIVIEQLKTDSATLEINTDMWLGATVATGTDFTIMCAPRYIPKLPKIPQRENLKNGTFGRCYVSFASSGNVTQMKILDEAHKEKDLEPYEKYMDSFGWASNVDRHDTIVIGGPAMHTGRAILYSDVTSYPKLISNRASSSVKFNFGYSVTSGLFLSSEEEDIIYAISSPYGKYGKGIVILMNDTFNWVLPNTIEYHPPVGSLFGGSLCSAKLRGLRQREALLVGAPLYAQNGMVDVGTVYIYQYDPAFKYVAHQRTILGTVNHGRFGSAILNLGDLNGDKRDEIAISAPYEDSDRGTVYIYSAADICDESADKVRYLQKIHSEVYSTLGFSMSALQTYNEAGCNELAIGVPANNLVLRYRCIPQIIVHVQRIKVLEKNRTRFRFELSIDIEYPAKPTYIKADIEVSVTLMHPTARIIEACDDAFIKYNISTIDHLESYKKIITIELPEDGVYDPVIQYQASVSQLKPPTDMNHFDNNIAMLSDLSTLSITDMIWVADCAEENECKPILKYDIKSSMRDGYQIGKTDSEWVSLIVENTGDPAYTACAKVTFEHIRVRRWPPACTRESTYSGICKPKQPIKNNTSWNSGHIELEIKSLTSYHKQIVIKTELYKNCSSDDDILYNTRIITLKTDSNGFDIKGYTNLGDVIPLSTVEIDETGKQLNHIYTITNKGFTTWVDVTIYITLEEKPYYKGFYVTVDSQEDHNCDKNIEIIGHHAKQCSVSSVKSNQKFDVIISIYIEPKTIDEGTLEKQNLNQTSRLLIQYGENHLEHSITSTLRKKDSVVPLWVIIVAAFVGLLIMSLLAFALYECGFLRRKNREKLEQLKRNVHRQSMRRSAMERESKRITNTAVEEQMDKRKLIEETDDDGKPSTPPCTNDGPALPPTAEGKNLSTELTENPKLQNPTGEPPKKISDSPSLGPNDTDEQKTRKELIILGLQKNIESSYPVKPPKSKAKQTNTEMAEGKEDI